MKPAAWRLIGRKWGTTAWEALELWSTCVSCFTCVSNTVKVHKCVQHVLQHCVLHSPGVLNCVFILKKMKSRVNYWVFPELQIFFPNFWSPPLKHPLEKSCVVPCLSCFTHVCNTAKVCVCVYVCNMCNFGLKIISHQFCAELVVNFGCCTQMPKRTCRWLTMQNGSGRLSPQVEVDESWCARPISRSPVAG